MKTKQLFLNKSFCAACILVLLFFGCAYPATYYQPLPGVGKIEQTPHTLFMKDRLRIHLDDSVDAYILFVENSDGAYGYLSFFIPNDSWIQILDNKYVISSQNNEYQMEMSDNVVGVSRGSAASKYSINDKLYGNSPNNGVTTYEIVLDTQRKFNEFNLTLPELLVNGKTIKIPSIGFRLKTSVVGHYGELM